MGKAFVALGEAIGAGMAAAVEALSGNVSGAKVIIAELKGSLVQRLDELAEFHDALFDPKPIELPAPAIRPDGSVLDRIGGTGRARDNTTARLALAKAQADAEFKLLKDALERQGRALDQALNDRLLSIRDYYAAKTELETREIDAEIARIQGLLTEQRRLAVSGADEGARLRARAEVAKLESELIVLNNKRADVEVANARKAADAERELADALTQAREELAQITGQSSAADRQAAIERSYPAEHPPIIDRELWDQAHAILATNGRVRGNTTRATVPYLLKGIVFGNDAITRNARNRPLSRPEPSLFSVWPAGKRRCGYRKINNLCAAVQRQPRPPVTSTTR